MSGVFGVASANVGAAQDLKKLPQQQLVVVVEVHRPECCPQHPPFSPKHPAEAFLNTLGHFHRHGQFGGNRGRGPAHVERVWILYIHVWGKSKITTRMIPFALMLQRINHSFVLIMEETIFGM